MRRAEADAGRGETQAEAHMWVLRIPDSALDQAGGTGLIERGVLLGEGR